MKNKSTRYSNKYTQDVTTLGFLTAVNMVTKPLKVLYASTAKSIKAMPTSP